MHFNGIYEQPLVRLGPYLVGIFFGYFMCRNNKSITLNKTVFTFGKFIVFMIRSKINNTIPLLCLILRMDNLSNTCCTDVIWTILC